MKLALALSLLASWQGATEITPYRLDQPQLAAGPDGSVFMAAAQTIDAEGRLLAQPLLSVRAAPPGAPFAAPQMLGEGVAAGVDATGAPTVLTQRDGRLSVGDTVLAGERARRPVLAVAPSGAALVAWLDGRRLMAAVREPGAAFRRFTVARDVPADTDIKPAIGARGDALLVWTPSHEYYLPGSAAIRRPGGRFAAPVRVSRQIGDIRAAVGADGTAVAAFTQTRPHDPHARTETRVYSAKPASRRFARQTLRCAGVAAAAVAPNGRTLVLCGETQLDAWEGTGTLKRTGRVGENSEYVAVDLAADGRAVVAWSRRTRQVPTASRVVAALRPAGGAFGPGEVITPQFDDVSPMAAALTADGGAVVVSESFGETGRTMLLSRSS